MLESYWRSWGHDLDQEITNVTESESTKGALEKNHISGTHKIYSVQIWG